MAFRGATARAAWLVTTGTLVSRALGLARAIVLAQAIGVTGSAGADAFGLANQLPNSIYAIVAGGLLGAVMVPQIARNAATSADSGQAFVNKLLTLSFCIAGAVTVVVTVAAPGLVALYASADASRGTDRFALALAFATWCLPQVFFYAAFTLLGEVLNARGRFGAAAWAPAINNIVSIAGLVSFVAVYGAAANRPASEWSPTAIAVVGGTATLGVALQSVVLAAAWKRSELTFRPTFKWRGVGLRGVASVSAWVFALLVLTQVAGVMQTNVALEAHGPSVAALQTSWLIFMLPHSVVTVALATVFFRRMSQAAAENDTTAIRADFSHLIRITLVMLVPAAAALGVASRPLARIFTQDTSGALAFAPVLFAQAAGAIGFCVAFLAQRAFYASGDGKSPFFLGILQLALFLALLMAARATVPASSLGAAIAAAASVSFVVQGVVALAALRCAWGGRVDGRRITSSLAKQVLAILPATGLGLAVAGMLSRNPGDFAMTGILPAAVSCLCIACIVAGTYAGLLWRLGSPELRIVASAVRGRRLVS